MRYGLVLTLGLVAALAIAGARDEEWKKVDEAIEKGLPRTAIEKLEPIIQAAIRDKAYPEAIKAITKKIALEGNIQGNQPQEKIRRLEAEIEKAPAGPVEVGLRVDFTLYDAMPARSAAEVVVPVDDVASRVAVEICKARCPDPFPCGGDDPALEPERSQLVVPAVIVRFLKRSQKRDIVAAAPLLTLVFILRSVGSPVVRGHEAQLFRLPVVVFVPFIVPRIGGLPAGSVFVFYETEKARAKPVCEEMPLGC
jgi:hypothetical protein